MRERIVTGFHAIEEKILSVKDKTAASELRIIYSKIGPRVKKIISAAETYGIRCVKTSERELDSAVCGLPDAFKDHRGILLFTSEDKSDKENLIDFDEWVLQAASKSTEERQTVIILDSITDPHNVGAIMRSAEQFGISLVILPERRGVKDVSENEVIARSSAGASSWVPTATVSNLVRTVKILKENGFWIYGADAGGESANKTDFAPRCALIMGSEGSGISRLLEEQCDKIVSIPTCGKLDSLNVSVAAGILLYEICGRKI